MMMDDDDSEVDDDDLESDDEDLESDDDEGLCSALKESRIFVGSFRVLFTNSLSPSLYS